MKEIKISFTELYTLHGSDVYHQLMLLSKEKGFPVTDSFLSPTPDMKVISKWRSFTDVKTDSIVIRWEEKE